MFLLCVLLLLPHFTQGAVLDFEKLGGIPEDPSLATCWENGKLLNATFARLAPGDIFVLPNKTFYSMGGIIAAGFSHVIFQIDGTLKYNNNMKAWPRVENGHVLECMHFINISDVTFTSKGKGTFDGSGKEWWGAVRYLEIQENRPRLFRIEGSRAIVVENLLFKDSPYWTVWIHEVDGLTIRWSDVMVRKTSGKHNLIDLQAFNTDGFDVTGRNVHIHDCNVYNDDDCVAIKDGSENMLIERVNASGVGLTIGSIGASVVRNITFRDCRMDDTFKGIYVKSRPATGTGSISDILYENIVINSPTQWSIWIGPAQQEDGKDCCSLLWPEVPWAKCPVSPNVTFSNITLRNIVVNNPSKSPGVLLGNKDVPMRNIVFDNVVINNPGTKPWGNEYYKCDGIEGTATGGTTPVPPCFQTLRSPFQR